jgi:hypothetical protein
MAPVVTACKGEGEVELPSLAEGLPTQPPPHPSRGYVDDKYDCYVKVYHTVDFFSVVLHKELFAVKLV